MHPDLIRAVAEQHVRDMQAAAQDGLRARLARRARKAQRRGSAAPGPLARLRVPDYVDGTFRADGRPEDSTTSAGRAGGAADARHGAAASRDAA
jgi:hypothetical protein